MTLGQVSCRTLRWHRGLFLHDQDQLEALVNDPNRPKMQPPYVRPRMPENQPCVLDNGSTGTVGPMTMKDD